MPNIFLRQWTMLRLIPRYPAKTNSSELTQRLADAGLTVGIRSVQRDLLQMAEIFPDLHNDGNRDITGWSWKRDGDILSLPATDPPTALTFKLAEIFLHKVIPPAMLRLLRPYFEGAEKVLNRLDQPGPSRWSSKVRILPRGQPLLPAAVRPEVVDVIYAALLGEQCFRGRYLRRNGDEAEYEFHPRGLIVRDSVSYLVATVWDYRDPRHYALHRFVQCTMEEKPISELNDFDLGRYIAAGSFEYVESLGKTIQLVVCFAATAGGHLFETPLAEDQQITAMPDGRFEISATVNDSQQLRWWLLGFGAQVEVVRPTALRLEFEKISRDLLARYSDQVD